MLERTWTAAQHGWREIEQRGEFITLSDVLAFSRRYALSIGIFSLVGLLIAGFFVATANRVYVARSEILIDPKLPDLLLQQPQSDVNLSIDTAQIESQLALLRSRKIAEMVIDKLKLDRNAKFLSLANPTFAERLRRLQAVFAGWGLHVNLVPGFLHGPKAPVDKAKARETAIDVFTRNLDVGRVGVSYAIEIQFQSVDSAQAAQVANEIADAYVHEQLENRSVATRQGLAWLEQRIKTVGKQMNDATRLVQEFRARHDFSVQDPPMVTPPRGMAIGADAGQKMPLDQLEVSATTYRKLYQSLLTAYSDSVGRQPDLYNNARVISTAVGPDRPSRPRTKLVLAFGLLAGFAIGAGLSVARYSVDRRVRSARQIRDEFDAPCIAELPVVRFRRGGFGRLDEVLREPYSLYAQNLRGVKLAMDLADPSQRRRLIGVTCVSPGDGKGTVVSNLAALYAASGVETLVVSADEKSPVAALLRKPENPSNDLELSADGSAPEQEDAAAAADSGGHVIRHEFLFDLIGSTPSMGDSKLLQENLKELISRTKKYKAVIVDLPPYSFGPDALIVTPAFDSVIVVADHKGTALDELGDLLQALRDIKANLSGVLLTRVRSVSVRRHRRLTGQVPR